MTVNGLRKDPQTAQTHRTMLDCRALFKSDDIHLPNPSFDTAGEFLRTPINS